MNILNKRLKKLREEKTLSQTQLGAKIGFAQSTIAKWESGTRMPNIDDLIVLAKFFDCSIDYLVGLEN